MREIQDRLMDIKDGCGFDVCGLKFVSHSHKFIFFEVPKTGSASLKKIFTEHASIIKLEKRFEFLDYPDYVRCAFVRNPWDRILSCYFDKIKKDENYEDEDFENGIMKKFKRFNVFYAGMSFSRFLKAVGNIPDEFSDGHFASQHKRLVMDGKIVTNFVGRFENYSTDVKKLLRMVGIDSDVKLPHINRTRNRKRYQEYYSDELKIIVEERYKEDINFFKYKF